MTQCVMSLPQSPTELYNVGYMTQKLKTFAYGKYVATNCAVSVRAVTSKCYAVCDRLKEWIQQTGEITVDTECDRCRILSWN